MKPVLKTHGFSQDIVPHPPGNIQSAVRIWGKEESRLLKDKSVSEKEKLLKKEMPPGVAIIIMTGGCLFPSGALQEARKKKIALFESDLSGEECRRRLKKIGISSGRIIISGGLLEIFDMGILIIGDSGIGKSESALELIARGHRFVSDDVTECRLSKEQLIGSAPEISRHFMEVRGLGIINIKEIFGPKAVCLQTEINLVIQLRRWKGGEGYDRMGLEFPSRLEILGVMVPQIRIPVAPGRNISNLIEVACKVHALRERGYHAPKEITKRLDRALSARKSGKKKHP